jgi:FkbM family methyltransferase
MIPKTIHYCWFGNNPMSETIIKCIDSWKKKLPDYTFQKWSEENYDIEHPFALAAYENKSWAFLADYVRFDVIYKYGGIYLDTDMLVLKSLNPLLENECFLGYEDEIRVNCAIIGAVKNHTFLKSCCEVYDKITFNSFLPPVPSLLTALIKRNPNHDVTLYSPNYFYPFPFINKEDNFNTFIQKDSYTVHLWEGSWLNEEHFFKNGFKKSALKKIWSNLKKQPIQPFENYLKYLKILTPKKVKVVLKFIFNKIIRAGLLIPFLRKKIINSNLSHSFRYFNFPSEKEFPMETIKIAQIDGITYKLNIAEHNGLRVYFKVFPISTWQLFNLIEPHFNIIDVGANIGFYSLNFAKKASKGNVFSFEPFQYNYQLLNQNIELNNFNNIKTYPIALGETTRKANMNNITNKNLGMVHIDLSSNNDENLITINTLDNFVKKNNSEKIHLIKIDIEGYETNFIKGAINTLTKDYPILFIEVIDQHLKKFDSSAFELIKTLEDLGYNYIINADTKQVIYSVFNLDNCSMDILCKKI